MGLLRFVCSKSGPFGPCFEGQRLLGGRGSQVRHVTGRACHFEKKKLRKDALHPFLASLFFARPFLLGSFWGVSPVATADQGAALDLQP